MIDKLLNKNIEQPKVKQENRLNVDVTNYSSSYGNSRSYRYVVNGDVMLSVNQVPFPSCCGIAILKDFSMFEGMQPDQFNDSINKIVEDLTKNDKYSKILIYTNKKSTTNKLLSTYENLTVLDSFLNPRSGNMLVGFEINIERELEEERSTNLDEYDRLVDLSRQAMNQIRAIRQSYPREMVSPTGGGIMDEINASSQRRYFNIDTEDDILEFLK